MQLSIIIPIYNTSRFLRGSVDSILSQSFTDFELILVDDGSIDDSLDICLQFAASDGRVKVIHQDNAGVSTARNRGLEEAQGEYVYFPDSDDFVTEKALELLVNGIGSNCNFATGGYQYLDEEGICTYSIDNTEEGYMSRDEMLMQFFAPSPYIYQGYLWNKLFKRSIIEENNIRFEPSIKFNEDRLFCVRYVCSLKQEERIYYNWKPVYQYVQRSTSAMASLTQRFNPNFLSDLDAFVKMGDVLRTIGANNRLMKAHFQSMLASVGRMYSICRQFGKLNLKWYYDIESRLYKGVGSSLYIYRWVSKIYRKLNKLLHKI